MLPTSSSRRVELGQSSGACFSWSAACVLRPRGGSAVYLLRHAGRCCNGGRDEGRPRERWHESRERPGHPFGKSATYACKTNETVGSLGWGTNTGHRDKVYDLVEISSTSTPTTCLRSCSRDDHHRRYSTGSRCCCRGPECSMLIVHGLDCRRVHPGRRRRKQNQI